MKREEWMLGPEEDKDQFSGLLSYSKSKGSSSKKVKNAASETKMKARELNPYFGNGGQGLPPGAEMLTGSGRLAKPSEDPESEGGKDRGEKEMAKLRVDEEAKTGNNDLMKMVREERVQRGPSSDRRMAAHIARKPKFCDLEGMGDRLCPSTSVAPTRTNNPRDQKECRFCTLPESGEVLAIGNYAFLCLAKYNYLDRLHCLIVPLEHVASMRRADDTVWDEVRNFKKCLISLGQSLQRPAIFLETASSSEDHPLHHTFIHCIFLPQTISTDPATFFRKALQDCEDQERAQNVSVIDTAVRGGLRKSIPRNFPYCYVDFRLDQGLVHLIEDQHKVGHDYLQELTAKLMGLERHQWRRRGHDEENDVAISRKEAFLRLFAPFDWTRLLHQANAAS